jgi:hypothetical protein
MVFICDCEQQCNGVATEVSRATYYRHAPFRSSHQIQPVDPALVAAHFGLASEEHPHDEDVIMHEVCFQVLYWILLDSN